MKKINLEIAQEIINSFVNGEKTSNLSKKFNVSSNTIINVIKGVCWKNAIRPQNMPLLLQGKITKEMAQKIIDLFYNGKSIIELSNLFKLSRTGIAEILHGKTWKDCIRPNDLEKLIIQKNKITQEMAQEIIEEYCHGSSCIELSKKYKLWSTSISNIIRGETWKECVRPENIKKIIQHHRDQGNYKSIESRRIEAPPFTNVQNDIIVGSLLGDGSLHKLYKNSNSSFSKTQSKNRFDYLQWHYDVLQPYSASVQETFSKEKLIGGKKGVILERQAVEKYHCGYRYQTVNHPNWTVLRNEWYPDGTKIVPTNLTLNPLRIAIWFFDDGTNSLSHRTAIFCTQSFTIEEVEFLCHKLEMFNLKSKIFTVTSTYTNKKMPLIKITKSSYDNLIEIIKPFMLWDCFKHKIDWRPAKKQWEVNGQFTLEQVKEIRELRKSKSAKEIAVIFNVHPNYIYSIVSGRSYKDCI